VAVIDADGSWTYGQLSRAAGRVARVLAERNAGTVGVVRGAAAGFAAAILGCGAAGVPFSVIEADDGLLPQPAVTTVLDPAPRGAVPDATVDVRALLRHLGGEGPTPARTGDDPGDTCPDWAAGRFELTADDRFAVLAGSTGHVVSALSTALALGATVALPGAEIAGQQAAMADWLRASGATVVYLTAPVLRALAAQDPATFPALRYLMVDNVGDLIAHDVELGRQLAGSVRLVSTYRSTLEGVPLAVYEVPRTWSAETAPLRVPAGVAVDGRLVPLVSPVGSPAVTGEVGEICVGTRRTGDLGRYLPDGTLEFAGRTGAPDADRLETAAALRDLPDVRDALVTEYIDLDGQTAPAAYIARGDAVVDLTGLRRHLAARIPERLLPEQLVVLDEFPLTPEGDYDLAALPDPGGDGTPIDAYVAPRTPVERQLIVIFSELLGLERIGISDTFFELHGFSLLATQLASRVRQAFAVDLSLREVFESPTVEGLAQIIVNAQIQGTDDDELRALLDQIE
jgi:hypothetical protein